MKRYRFSSFFFDGTRAILRDERIPPDILKTEQEQTKGLLKYQHGEVNLDEKYNRFMEFDTPNIRLITEYNSILIEIEHSYISGHYYPALTAACCLGERILNILILKLRDYYRGHKLYKRVHGKESFQDWYEAINTLKEWDVIDDKLKEQYEKLAELRNDSIHLKEIGDFKDRALTALKSIMFITDRLFGLQSNVFFWCPGELYIRKDKENLPIVKEFFLPSCVYVGYKYKTHDAGPSDKIMIRFEDVDDYEERDITDEEFRELRIKFQEQK